MGIGQLCPPQTGSIVEIECTLSGHPYNEGVTPQKLDTCTTFLVLPKATPIVGWLQNDYCQAHVAANGFCGLNLLFSVSVPAPSSFTKMLDPCTHNVCMCLFTHCYSMAGHRRHAYCTMAGHRRHAYCTMAGHREGMVTVQWLGTEKACVLYNGWAQRRHAYCTMAGHREGMVTVQWLGTKKACVLYNGWAQRRHAYCTMAGHREGMRTVQWLGTEKAWLLYNGWAQRRHAYCTMAGHRELRHGYCTMAGHREGRLLYNGWAQRRHGYCTMAGHKEGKRTVQWLGTEKAWLLYNGWAQIHCAKNVVYDSVYFCVYFAYTINIPRVVYITNIHLVYFKNPQVTIIHCAYSRSIKNTQTTMNLQIR